MMCNVLTLRRFITSITAALLALAAAGCLGSGEKPVTTAKLQDVDLNNPVLPVMNEQAVSLAAAKNEWTSFQINVSGLPAPDAKTSYTLRLQSLNFASANHVIGPANFTAYQVLTMPVDVNRAGYVRHTGLSAATRNLPRALVPLPVNDGRINLANARDPDAPTDPTAHANGKPVMVWIDVHIPAETPAGKYAGVCEIIQSGVAKPIASLSVQLNVYDLVIPDERHLNLVGQLDWDGLSRLYPDRFEAVTPRLMNRADTRYQPAIKTIDQLVKLAESHRVQVVVPRLQPSVKWPGGRSPVVTWEDFDTIVSPWMSGQMFDDKVPLGYWPLPAAEGLANFDPLSQREYWTEAATHFDQLDWLTRSPVFIEKATPGRASAMECIKISGDAASVLLAHPRIRVAVPLEDDQLQFATGNNRELLRSNDTERLIAANPGVVFSSPLQRWPDGVTRPARWMRTDLTGLIPYVGAGGDERDTRLWAWLSFLPLPPPQLGAQYGPVQFIRWGSALPSNTLPTEAADPNELIWFYPGSWFGLDQPVPTIQLKWLRRAQQDFEYLYLLRQRGGAVTALFMSRLMTKPVQLQPSEQPDPTYGLMCGTPDAATWDQAIDLIARKILLYEPGQAVDPEKDHQLNIQMLGWSQPQEQPVIMGRTTLWGYESQGQQRWADLRLGVDIYNASDSTPDENSLTWMTMPDQSPWQIRPQPIPVPALATYRVQRSDVDARVDLAKLWKAERRPVQLVFTNGHNRNTTPVNLILPVAATDRREGMLKMDGSLDDWTPDDAIQDGPLVRMFNRPALQSRQLQSATLPTQIYTGWADENFYLAFKTSGLSKTPITTVRNFVNYQFRRAWGEDLVEILVQAIYADNSVGPVLHIVCKPTGHWIERKMDPRQFADPWQPFEGTGLRYVATLNDSDWRAEVAIPWKVINDANKDLPVMLRFNFSQHRQDTGESASWAGPVDFGRDDDFTGILVLREPQTPGIYRAPR